MPVRFKIAIGVLLVAAFFIAAVSINLLTRIDSTSRRNADAAKLALLTAKTNSCSNRLIADFAAAAGRALAAPPAPNPAREAAVADILRAADRLTNSVKTCKDGVPAPMTPTPVKP
jgi:hypothetical protein